MSLSALNMGQLFVTTAIIHDNQPITYLVGNPGTGKSFTISTIIKHYKGKVTLTATTHKACESLAKLTNSEVQTIHSYLGYILSTHNFKQVLVPRSNYEPEPCDLLIIDEISLIPNKLLSVALNLLHKKYKQILLVGDPIQLPAVSDAPDLSQLEQYKHELTEQMRQTACPKLASYLQSYRDGIVSNTLPPLLTDAPSISFIDHHKDFCTQYLKCTEQKKILAYRNSVVDKYNQTLSGGDQLFNPGDEVIINKPIAGFCNNNDKLLISAATIDPTDTYYNIKLNRIGTREYASVRVYHKKSVLTMQLEKYKQDKDEDAYWDLYHKAVDLKHIYASTVHKAQGETIDHVFIDAYDIISAFLARPTRYTKPLSQNMVLRLLYVAISRMRVHAYIFTGNHDGKRYYDTLTKPIKQIKYKPKPAPLTNI